MKQNKNEVALVRITASLTHWEENLAVVVGLSNPLIRDENVAIRASRLTNHTDCSFEVGRTSCDLCTEYHQMNSRMNSSGSFLRCPDCPLAISGNTCDSESLYSAVEKTKTLAELKIAVQAMVDVLRKLKEEYAAKVKEEKKGVWCTNFNTKGKNNIFTEKLYRAVSDKTGIEIRISPDAVDRNGNPLPSHKAIYVLDPSKKVDFHKAINQAGDEARFTKPSTPPYHFTVENINDLNLGRYVDKSNGICILEKTGESMLMVLISTEILNKFSFGDNLLVGDRILPGWGFDGHLMAANSWGYNYRIKDNEGFKGKSFNISEKEEIISQLSALRHLATQKIISKKPEIIVNVTPG